MKKANFHTSFTARKSVPNGILKSAQYKTPLFISRPCIQAALKIAKENTSRDFYFGLYGIMKTKSTLINHSTKMNWQLFSQSKTRVLIKMQKEQKSIRNVAFLHNKWQIYTKFQSDNSDLKHTVTCRLTDGLKKK